MISCISRSMTTHLDSNESQSFVYLWESGFGYGVVPKLAWERKSGIDGPRGRGRLGTRLL